MADIIFGEELRQKIEKGAGTASRLVAANLGPEGRNTVCDREYDLPVAANSGSRILKDFCLKDRGENLAAVLVRDAGQKISDHYGDGNISTVLLTDMLIQKGFKLIAAGFNPIQMRKGLHKMLEQTGRLLNEMMISAQPDTVQRFAESAGKQEEIGKIIMEAYRKTGSDGVITVADSQARETTLRFWDGVRYDSGLWSVSHAMNKEKKCTELKNPRVLLCNVKVQSIREIKNLLEEAVQENTPLLMIFNDISEEVQTTIAMNVNKGILKAAVAKAPGYGETRRRNMLALASRIGSVLVDENTGVQLENRGLDLCAPIRYAKVDKESTILQGFPMASEELTEKMRKFTKARLEETSDADEREKLYTTLAILNGKSAEIQVGAAVEYEMFEKKYLYENTLRAVENSLVSGFVPGAGNAFFWLGKNLRNKAEKLTEEERAGALCLCEALEEFICRLAENEGVDPQTAAHQVLCANDPYKGYDVLSQQVIDLRERGILMPRNTVQAIVFTSANTAASLWTTQAAVLAEK